MIDKHLDTVLKPNPVRNALLIFILSVEMESRFVTTIVIGQVAYLLLRPFILRD